VTSIGTQARPPDVGSGRDRQTGPEPIHPRWTHLPIGGVVLVALFDVVSLAGDARPWAHELYRAGTFVLMAASATMVVTIASGLVDRAHHARDRDARSRANWHAVLMALMAVAAVADLALRRLIHPDAQRTPATAVALSLVALVSSVVGGDLGGRLTYRLGVGVRRPRPWQPEGSDG
jgi:uncharacterized membrane protein